MSSDYIIVPDWPAPRNVRACVTTRQGGVSTGPYASFNLGDHVGDAPAAVAENRGRLRALLPAEPAWLKQVHGTRCIDAAQALVGNEADAAFARASHVVCAVLTADCLPVLLCDEKGTVVAAAHAGWRGLAAGVIEATVAAMGLPGEQLMAWLGPAIGPENFEVGDEVRTIFVTHDPLVSLLSDRRLVMRQGGVDKILRPDGCELHIREMVARMDLTLCRFRERIRAGELLTEPGFTV